MKLLKEHIHTTMTEAEIEDLINCFGNLETTEDAAYLYDPLTKRYVDKIQNAKVFAALSQMKAEIERRWADYRDTFDRGVV